MRWRSTRRRWTCWRDRASRWPGRRNYGSVTQYLQAEGASLDLVHVYRYANAAMLLDRVRELAPDAKLVFATADLHFLREQRRAELAGQAASTDAAREEELRCMRAADATIITSDHEMDVLRGEIEPDKLVLLRWITRPQPACAGFRRTAGHLLRRQFPPSAQPRRRAVVPGRSPAAGAGKLPEVRLLLAGSGMPPAIKDLATDGVEVLGWVEDLAGLFGIGAPVRGAAAFRRRLQGQGRDQPRPRLAGGRLVDLAGRHRPAARRRRGGCGHAGRFRPRDRAAARGRGAVAGAVGAGMERVADLYSPDAALAVWRGLLGRLVLPVRDS